MSKKVIRCNTTAQMIDYIPWQKAVNKVLAGEAISLRDSTRLLRSPSMSIFVPEIIMMTDYVNQHNPYREVKRRDPNEPLPKRLVHDRDGWVCAYCGGYGDTIDHIVPKDKGGQETWDNVITACFGCNNKKDNKMLIEIGWILRYEPVPLTYEAIYRAEQEEINDILFELSGAVRTPAI